MQVYIDSKQGSIRVYKNGSYEEKSRYDAIASFVKLTDDIIYVYGYLGKPIKELYLEFIRQLKEMGIAHLIYEKSDGWTMRGSSHFYKDLWKIDL